MKAWTLIRLTHWNAKQNVSLHIAKMVTSFKSQPNGNVMKESWWACVRIQANFNQQLFFPLLYPYQYNTKMVIVIESIRFIYFYLWYFVWGLLPRAFVSALFRQLVCCCCCFCCTAVHTIISTLPICSSLAYREIFPASFSLCSWLTFFYSSHFACRRRRTLSLALYCWCCFLELGHIKRLKIAISTNVNFVTCCVLI